MQSQKLRNCNESKVLTRCCIKLVKKLIGVLDPDWNPDANVFPVADETNLDSK